ncbi:hypothetical protein PtB15_15B299 [Puccinia triticina]|nr:hypothetical protein PtB15_15B299 [Puccinia triticina]
MIGGLQSQLASGHLTQDIAYQRVQKLTASFQATLNEANGCGICFNNPGHSSSVASSTMIQFTNFKSLLQTTFGKSPFTQISASVFLNLTSLFQKFFQQTTDSLSFSFNSIITQNFGPVMQDIMPFLVPSLEHLVFQKKQSLFHSFSPPWKIS